MDVLCEIVCKYVAIFRGNGIRGNVFAPKKNEDLIRSMRQAAFFLVFLSSVWVGSAQNKWKRMQPEDWLALDVVQEGLAMLQEDADAFYSEVNFHEGSIATAAGSEGAIIGRGGDLRIVLDSTGRNLSKSHNVGFNYNRKLLFWNDRCYAAGGRGFWTFHSKLVEFVPTTGEWELQSVDEAPSHVNHVSSWWDANASKLVAIEEPALMTTEGEMAKAVRALEFGKDWKWTLEGQVNPALSRHFSSSSFASFDLGDYFIWVGLHKTLIVSKVDMLFTFTEALNGGMLEEIGYFRKKSSCKLFQTTTTKGALRLRCIPEAEGESKEWTVDIRQAFEESRAEAQPFVVPVDFLDDTEPVREDSANLWGGLILLMLVGVSGFFGGQYWSKFPVQMPDPEAGPSKTSIEPGRSPIPEKMSDLTQQFLQLESPSFDTAQLNTMLAFTDDLSEETRRARRAQAVRKVNQEYELWYNQPLIIRTKDTLDRRRTIYVIQRHSDNA